MNYTWRDVERRSQFYGLPFRARPPYPLKRFELVNRVALVGAQEGWCADFTRAAYRRWFVEHDEAGSESNNEASLRDVGQDPDAVLARADSGEVRQALEAETAEARTHGIFGVPTFATGGEIFWGDDRLDDAIKWHRRDGRRHSRPSI